MEEKKTIQKEETKDEKPIAKNSLIKKKIKKKVNIKKRKKTSWEDLSSCSEEFSPLSKDSSNSNDFSNPSDSETSSMEPGK